MIKKISKYAIILVLIFMILSLVDSPLSKRDKKQWIPSQGFVPNELTARKIAESILIPIYGKEIIKQKPFNVELIRDSVWVVTGTQNELALSGVAYIEIQKSDCRILKVTHGK
ncbi:YbbC/YhhH family protein [Brumimicrobium sp.]|uniref:YbbC/YhhH family protein n=1 Tax=Brumimicrobium sp. TaxID=2029867 RepID=UPI003A939163